MNTARRPLVILAFSACFLLLACGGGSGGNVSQAPAPVGVPVILSFTATPSIVNPGSPVVLAWTENDVPCQATVSTLGAINTGQTTVTPWVTTSYTLTLTNPSGSAQAQVTVTMNPQAPPPVLTATLPSGTTMVNSLQGQVTNLQWSAPGANQVLLSGQGSIIAGSGTVPLSPSATTTYTITAGNGISSTSTQVTVYVVPVANLVANDLVYSSATRTLYASIPATAPGAGGVVAAIEPGTMAVLASLPAGQNPDALGLSDDGTTLYVGEDDAHVILPVDLTTFTAGTAFPIWAGDDEVIAGSIRVLPGTTGSLAATRAYPGPAGNRPYAVTVYDQGVPRPTSFLCGTWNWPSTLQFGDTADTLYALDTYLDDGGDLSVLSVDTSGITLQSTYLAPFGSSFGGSAFVYAQGNFYFGSGGVARASDFALLGQFPAPSGSTALLPDFDQGVVYQGDFFGNIQLHDLGTFRSLGSVTLNGQAALTGSNPIINKFVKTGTSGLAVLTGQYIGFLQTPLPTIPALTASALEVSPGTPVALSFGVSGATTLSAWGEDAQGNLASLATTGTGAVVTPQVTTLYTLCAGSSSLCATRNLIICAQPGLALPSLGLPANDVAYSPLTQALYVTVPSWYGNLGNTLTALDPGTGAVLTSLYLGSEPGQMAMSSDGSMVYVLMNGGFSIQPVDLAGGTLGTLMTFLGAPDGMTTVNGPAETWWTGISAMAVMPGFPNTLAVSVDGVELLDNGMPRSTMSNAGVTWMQFTTDGSQVFGESSSYLYQMPVDASGITLGSTSPRMGLAGNPVWAGDDLYFPYGNIIGTSNWTQVQGMHSPVDSLSGCSSVCPDAAAQLVYYSNNTSILAFGMSDNLQKSAYQLNYHSSGAVMGKMIRFGQAGLLFNCADNWSWPTVAWMNPDLSIPFLLSTTSLQ